MEDYIYYRILDHLVKYGKASKSDLISAAGLSNWVYSPFLFLYENKFIEETGGYLDGFKYYKLTSKGITLYKKMKVFYEEFKPVYTGNNKKLKVLILNGFNNDR